MMSPSEDAVHFGLVTAVSGFSAAANALLIVALILRYRVRVFSCQKNIVSEIDLHIPAEKQSSVPKS